VRPPCPSVSTLRPLSGDCPGDVVRGRLVVPGIAAVAVFAVALVARRWRIAPRGG
jgi:hypothetical protein